MDDPGDGTDTGTTTTVAPTTTTVVAATTGVVVASTSAALLSDPAEGTFTLAALPVAAAVTSNAGSAQVAGVVASTARATPLPTTGRNSRGQFALGLSALSAGLIVVGLTRRRALAEVPSAD